MLPVVTIIIITIILMNIQRSLLRKFECDLLSRDCLFANRQRSCV